jgi:hypothetical protein
MIIKPNIQGPFSRIGYEPINLNSPEQIKKHLLKLGWNPETWNYKKKKGSKQFERDQRGRLIRTSPKLPKGRELEALEKRIQSPIGKLIARRYVLKHRKSILINDEDENKGWLGMVRDDGRLGAVCIGQATNTGRARHKVVVNCPKPGVVYGEELRGCLTTADDKVMVGSDAKGLEARMEAHNCYPFTGGKGYAEEILEGDIHTKNAIIFGTDRNGAKSPKYAIIYGCQPPKLADTLGCNLKKAKKLWENFWNGNTALKECKEFLEDQYMKLGFIIGLDGRKIFIRSKHSIVNAKFQSDGSIVVKTAMCFLFNRWVLQEKLDAKLVLFQHDEFQAEVDPKDSKRYKELADKSFKVAGEYYKLNVPLEGDSKEGLNWAQTH